MALVGKNDPKLGQAPKGLRWWRCDCKKRDCHRRFLVGERVPKEAVILSHECDPNNLVIERMVVTEDDRGQKTYGPLFTYQNPVPTV